MILVRNLRLEIDEPHDALISKGAGKLKIRKEKIRSFILVKKSFDARKKDDLHYICSAAFDVSGNEAQIMKSSRSQDVSLYKDEAEEYSRSIPQLQLPSESDRPVIVGFGPAGMFAALVLAKAGLRPIVIERGKKASDRKESIENLRRNGILDPESNVQFGEGGAGTFSDGKLNTGTHDSRISYVLREFFRHGAKENILYDSKPHIGTDILINVVQNIREEIISLGGDVRFETRLERITLSEGRVTGIEVSSHSEKQLVSCSRLILAIGHSARDTFEMLLKAGVPMERKAFSMGARIEHLQKDINAAQYGKNSSLPMAADYSLSVHLPDLPGVYTFCMCPGGEVFAAASEEGGVCTNGMSYSSRNGENANSALLVSLQPEDFPYDGVLAGMLWQREIEQRAFSCAGRNYSAPSQLVGDFLSGRPSTGAGKVKPSYLPGVAWGDLHEVLPEKITSAMEKAIPELGRKLSGFDDPEAVLTAPECRSSSPVRILRGKNLQSEIAGLFPCGEGAGYAGGITSAAVDGIRCAEMIIEEMNHKGTL